jgi:DNA-binding LacI/PurR family transcriptional regulator
MSTKYQRIARSLGERIREGQYAPGEALPSEVSLAEEFGVNRMTLRKALNVLQKKDYIVRHRGRGTFVKFEGQRRRSGTLVYVGETESHFYRDLYLAVCREAQAGGRAAVSYSPGQEDGDPSESSHLRKLLEDATGVICDADHWAGLMEAIPEELPVVRLSKSYPESPSEPDDRGGYVVAADGLRAAQLATRHLTALGHQRIGYLCVRDEPGGPLGLGRAHPLRPIYQGYQAGLREAGIADEFVIPFPPGDFQEGGRRALREFVEHVDDLPTGYVCDGDFRASPLLEVMRREGLEAPEDFSVVGVGNTPWCKIVTPALCSVSLQEKEMARMAVMLCERRPADAEAVVQVRPRLIQRQSTARAPEPAKAATAGAS